MATSSKAKIQVETGRTLVSAVAMTDSDHQIFYKGTIWSMYDGSEPTIMPDGMVTGRNVLSIHASSDTVTVAAFTAYSKGTLRSVSATTDTFTRGTGPGKAKVISVYMGSDGNIAVVPGEEGAGATFSDTRAAAGGPPLIPVGGIEIGQIRTTVSTPQALVATEIFQVTGSHVERYDYPDWEEFPLGKGLQADTTNEKYSHIKFSSALPAIHTGTTYKHVYAQYYTPIFSDVSKTLDFVAAETTHSVSSTEYYNGSIASSSSSLGQSSFTALMTDNVTDALLLQKNEVIAVKFYPNRNNAPYILTQGTLGMSRTFPVADQNQASCTISAELASVDFAS